MPWPIGFGGGPMTLHLVPIASDPLMDRVLSFLRIYGMADAETIATYQRTMAGQPGARDDGRIIGDALDELVWRGMAATDGREYWAVTS